MKIFQIKQIALAISLISVFANVQAMWETTKEPGEMKALLQDPEHVKNLITNGANPNAFLSKGHQPLHLAIFFNSPLATVTALLDAGADPNGLNKHGRTPLQMIGAESRYTNVKKLLANGANQNVTTEWNWTPLHYAVYHTVNYTVGTSGYDQDFELVYNNIKIAKALLKAGADHTIQISQGPNKGLTPLDLATVDHIKTKLLAHIYSLEEKKTLCNENTNN